MDGEGYWLVTILKSDSVSKQPNGHSVMVRFQRKGLTFSLISRKFGAGDFVALLKALLTLICSHRDNSGMSFGIIRGISEEDKHDY